MEKYYGIIVALLSVLESCLRGKVVKALLNELHDTLLNFKHEADQLKGKNEEFISLLKHDVLVNLVFHEYSHRSITPSDKLSCVRMLRDANAKLSLKEAKDLCDSVFGVLNLEEGTGYNKFTPGQSVYLTYMSLHQALKMMHLAEQNEDLCYAVTIEFDGDDLPTIPYID